uniref:Uncharacterized protein n=1 Tax=Glossina brevipalpis TaxID=37001 RepID=A0A1A9WSY6_9MUSC
MYGGIGTVMCMTGSEFSLTTPTQKFYAESTNSVADSSIIGSTEAAAVIPLTLNRNSLHCQRKVLIKARSTSSVSTIEQNFPDSTIVATTTPIASLHNHAATQSVLCLSAFEKDLRKSTLIQPVNKLQQSHQHRNKRLFQQQLSTPIEGVITASTSSASPSASDYSSASKPTLKMIDDAL